MEKRKKQYGDSFSTQDAHKRTRSIKEAVEHGQFFKRKCKLLKHDMIRLSGNGSKCSNCDKRFQHARDLLLHMKTCKEDTYDFQHSRSKKVFNARIDLKEHELVHASIECDSESSECSTIKRTMSIHQHLCSECGKRFHTVGQLRLHERVHPVKMPFQCFKCDKKYAKELDLLEHACTRLSDEDDERYDGLRCSDCGEHFTRRKQLILHAKSHKQKEMSCSLRRKVCQNEKSAEEDLLTRVGKNENDIKIKEQSIRLNGGKDLARKIKQPEEECSKCSMRFMRRTDLIRHMQIHLEIEQLQFHLQPNESHLDSDEGSKESILSAVKERSNRFHRDKSLAVKAAVKIKQPEEECNKCSMRFMRRTDLIHHMQIHLEMEQLQFDLQPNKSHLDSNEESNESILSKVEERGRQLAVKTVGKPKGTKEVCNKCDMHFMRRCDLIYHMQTHLEIEQLQFHESSVIETNVVPNQEPFLAVSGHEEGSNEMFKGSKSSILSAVQKRSNRSNKELTIKAAKIKQPEEQCNKCSMRFMRRTDLIHHMQIHLEMEQLHFDPQPNASHPDIDEGSDESILSKVEERGKTRSLGVKASEIKQPEEQCSKCDMRFMRRTELIRHMQTHLEKEQHNLPFDESFVTETNRVIKAESLHSDSGEGFDESILSKIEEMSNRSHKGKQLAAVKVSEMKQPEEQCNKCSMRFMRRTDLVRHMLIHMEMEHQKLRLNESFVTETNALPKQEPLLYPDKYGGSEVSRSSKLLFQCLECEENYTTKHDLARHTENIHSTGNLGSGPNCRQLGSVMMCEENDAEAEIFPCLQCGKKFVNEKSFKVHELIHPGVKCWDCGEHFVRRSDLVRHLINEHEYSDCDEKFITELSKQEEIDTDLTKRAINKLPAVITETNRTKVMKPIKCPKCNKTYYRNRDLSRHKCPNFNKELYTCSHCNKRFQESEKFLLHVQCHLESFACSRCGKMFENEEEMKVHERNHSGNYFSSIDSIMTEIERQSSETGQIDSGPGTSNEFLKVLIKEELIKDNEEIFTNQSASNSVFIKEERKSDDETIEHKESSNKIFGYPNMEIKMECDPLSESYQS